ncbi:MULTISPECIES: glycerophosphodiester phosphodiesterase family protein [Rhodopseudomonas]|uniref:glycerophosphodiester phosphodiesterase n=1 Tax=Rhodopseudomonas palustris TaxID=1076 RepID=A0A0D7E733_RHOPL|nr:MULTISPECIES: glycerophosphodiester phosphodiesterase family protein [Rhodopseudomonas]KIZ35332.1 glycerophosphodiester phosphodiesterase [Rhodopseudomonas palustris]MDF3811251.1 glycerophosphodiester phosphodiesterase family protein [Rhodopseudomonas sp. BAL398]WOK18576.1 glycerophosphodiester phosphodiesterase family protein [Rhodopseudomonas sp. BAL398]
MSANLLLRCCALLALSLIASATAQAQTAEVGPRPFYLVDKMKDGPLKTRLGQCRGPFHPTAFSIGHRGAPLQFPEHSRESYSAAARMGAGVIECDVTFTKDRQLVCRHSQCDLHTTTNILSVPALAAKCSQPFSPADPATGKKASAKCCTSDITLAEFKTLTAKMDASNPNATTIADYQNATPRWRTDLYASSATLMTHAESIALIKSLGRKFTPELKAPEVPMPFDGDYTQEAYASQMLAEYKTAGIPPQDVFPQSFSLADILYWIRTAPDFAAQAVFLEDRYETKGLDPNKPESWKPSMAELKAQGVNILAPPIALMLTLDETGAIVPSPYARAAKAAGLDLIGWSLERDGPLAKGGGFYHASIKPAIDRDGDTLTVLDILTRQVGIRAMFSDWPATTTFYANCMGMK